jgi:hypothetical protein
MTRSHVLDLLMAKLRHNVQPYCALRHRSASSATVMRPARSEATDIARATCPKSCRTATTRPTKLSQPFTRWSIRKLLAYLRKVHGRVIRIGREALR